MKAPALAFGLALAATPAAALPAREVHCLATAVYHEARGEPFAGQLAVAHVALNRGRPCRVIGPGWGGAWQRRPGAYGIPRDRAAWAHALAVARIAAEDRDGDPTSGATHFDCRECRPYWAAGMRVAAVIGGHVFYVGRGAG